MSKSLIQEPIPCTMKRVVLFSTLISLIFMACSSPKTANKPLPKEVNYTVQSLEIQDTAALSMIEQPQTEQGSFILKPGFYTADFKSYCLQPGTPDPTPRDAYFQAPVNHPRKEIIETILKNSQTATDLDQRNIQLLLWGVVSRTEFSKLPSPVQYTGRRLLNTKQVFELNGGVMGVVKTVAAVMPSGGTLGDIQQVFNTGVNSYEAYERIAVPRTLSQMRKPEFKLNQWYRHEQGYYVRYYPDGYKKTNIQVYVPETTADGENLINYILFDPTSISIAPANTNAQRLGIGAPVVIDIIRTVIKVIDLDKPTRPAKKETPKNPKDA